MFLLLAHTKLEIYAVTRAFCLACYRITNDFPVIEKYAMTQQIRRAALSAHLNLAEGCSRKSPLERRRFFEISRGSVVEVDACLDLAVELKYVTPEKLEPLGKLLVQAFKLASGMIVGR